jgi:hypothetical protein
MKTHLLAVIESASHGDQVSLKILDLISSKVLKEMGLNKRI